MPNQLISRTGRKRLLVALAVAAFAVLSASTAKAKTIWTVTVDVSSGSERPVYTYSPTDGPNCAGPNAKQSAEYLYVCPGDTVNWVVKTSTTNSLLTVFFKQPVLDDATTHVPTQWFHAPNGQSAGGPIDNNALPNIYEYCVGVLDTHTNHLYVHDPKIIVGTGGGTDDVAHEIMKDCDQLQHRADSDAESQAKKLCKEIDSDVQTLENLVRRK